MTDRVATLSGKLTIRPWREGNHDTLYCGDSIVTQWALEQIGPTEDRQTDRSYGRLVRVHYWIDEVEGAPEDVRRREPGFLHAGVASVEWGAIYSETRKYLGIDDELLIGGYDLLDELSDLTGHYLLLELTISEHGRRGLRERKVVSPHRSRRMVRPRTVRGKRQCRHR